MKIECCRHLRLFLLFSLISTFFSPVFFPESSALYAQAGKKDKKKYVVGVARFQNKTGKTGLNFLSDSISEQVSTTLASDSSITVVERGQLSSVLNEIELSQSGLMGDAKAMRELKLSGADYLVVGTFTGNSSRLTVSIRLVEVETGKVLSGRTAQGPVEDILDKVSYESASLFEMIRGRKFGFLTVTSQPSDATVFIDGRSMGQTPVSRINLPTGPHEVRLYKSGYDDYVTTVIVQENRVTQVQGGLAKIAVKNMLGVYAGLDYPIYFSEYAKSHVIFKAGFYYMYRYLRAGLEFSYSLPMDQSYTFSVPYSTAAFARELTVASLFLTIVGRPFLYSNYVSPYAGATIGAIWQQHAAPADTASDYHVQSQYYAAGPVAGVSILPYARIRFFIEARYLWGISPVYDARISQVELSGKIIEEKIIANADIFIIGAGVSVQF